MPQTIVVTGASAGIGRATVRLFARRGADITLVARGRAGLDAAAHEVEELGGRPLVREADTADPQQVEDVAAAAEETFGPIDVWINCAFTSVFAPFDEITPEEYRRVTEVTCLGFVNGTRAALRRMLPRDRGTIVQVGSALGERAIPLQSAYCGAKHAVDGFTSSVRVELLHRRSNVHITIAQLPAVNTPAVLLGTVTRAPASATGPADLPARGRRPRHPARRRPPETQAVLHRSHDRGDHLGQPPRPRCAGPVPGPHRVRRAADGQPGPAEPGQPVLSGRCTTR
ncbi:hypothetical protein Scel_81930 [Streptomyces cellostaticus]|nr:hypothetical protein Scel_81930 [Streptomyces cellostaticus]